jgi:hypothetical protein
MCGSRRHVASLPLVLVLLLAPVLLAGCSEPERFFELGRRFAPEAPPPSQARIYVFWPPASPAFRGTYHLAAPLSAVQLLPGGYLSHAALPGRIVFQIERSWRLAATPWLLLGQTPCGDRSLNASDGSKVGTFTAGGDLNGPRALAFDGAHIWVANANGNSLDKL